METGKAIAGTGLIFSSAILFGCRCIAAAIISTSPAASYRSGLADIGWGILLLAWALLGIGLFIFMPSSVDKLRAEQVLRRLRE